MRLKLARPSLRGPRSVLIEERRQKAVRQPIRLQIDLVRRITYIDNVRTVSNNILVLITWDDRKNEANFKKHGIWFEEAQSVILNSLSLIATNDHPGDDRMEYLGYSQDSKLLYVVTAEQSEDRIRILSARKATPNERAGYEKGI